jgi:hypothetical protein
VGCRASNAKRAYVWIKGVAGVSFTRPDFGSNNGESYDPVYCVEISGDANDINFTDASLIPRGPLVAATDIFGFTSYTNATGVFSLVNLNSEQTRYAIVSDADTPAIPQLKITGGRWASASNFFNLNAATSLGGFALTSGADVSGNLNLSPNVWARVTGCYFGGPVTLTGKGLTASDLSFSGNTCVGDLTRTGAWKKLRGTDRNNVVLGTYADDATGDTQANYEPFVKELANVSLTSVHAQNVFVIPAGKTFVCTGGYAVITSVTGYNAAVAPSFFLDSGGGTGELAAVGAINTAVFNAVGRVVYLTPFTIGTGAIALPETTVRVYVLTANTSSSLIVRIFVTGFYVT